MKKFLSLVLALVMTASLVTVSAGAKEFKDDADVTYDEAVAVISEVGVVDGYEDDSFKPGNTLTRGAAAKIICNLILGPTTAAELKADTAPYKDVPVSNVFSGYIAYCAKEGIISGYADGSFRPAGTLTGYAFMKMLLGALGYDSENEGYTGANWSIAVAKQAIGIGLNAGLVDEFNGVDFVTREEAALYAFNTLKATMVDYEQKITTNINGVEVVISQGNEKPVTWTEGKNNDGNIKSDGFVQFAEEFFPKLERNDDHDKFMRPANNWVYDKTDIGTYARYDLLVESYTEGVTGRDVYDLLKAGVIKDNDIESYVDGKDNTIKEADLVRSNNDDLTATGDGVVTEIYLDTDNDVITFVSINTYLAKATGDYNESKEYAPLNVYVKDASGRNYNVDVEDVANVVDVKADAFYQVNISYKDNDTLGEVMIINDVEVLEDSTVTKFSTDDSKVTKLTTGGEEYKANVKAFYDEDVLDAYNETLLTDATYTIYVDANGYFLGVELFEGTKNYVFIPGFDLDNSHIGTSTAKASAIFLDGTMAAITVNVKDTNTNIQKARDNADGNPVGEDDHAAKDFATWTAGTEDLNQWYTYTVDSNNVYTLKPAVRMTSSVYGDAGKDDVIRTDNLSITGNVGVNNNRVYGEDATVFVTVDMGKVNGSTVNNAITEVDGVYTGVQNVDVEIDKDAEAIRMGQVFTVYDSDYYVIGAVVLGEATGSAQNLAFILTDAKSEGKDEDGNYYWEFDAILGGEIKTLTARSKYMNTIDPLHKWTVQELRFDGEYVTSVKDVDSGKIYTNTADPIEGKDVYQIKNLTALTSTLFLQGRTMYVKSNRTTDVGLGLIGDAKAVVIQKENGKDNVKTEFASVGSAISHLADADAATAGTQYAGDIYAILDSDGRATWVVFDSATELKTGSQGPIVPPTGYDPVVSQNGNFLNVKANTNNDVDMIVYTAAWNWLVDNGYNVVNAQKDGTSSWIFIATKGGNNYFFNTNLITMVEVTLNGTEKFVEEGTLTLSGPNYYKHNAAPANGYPIQDGGSDDHVTTGNSVTLAWADNGCVIDDGLYSYTIGSTKYYDKSGAAITLTGSYYTLDDASNNMVTTAYSASGLKLDASMDSKTIVGRWMVNVSGDPVQYVKDGQSSNAVASLKASTTYRTDDGKFVPTDGSKQFAAVSHDIVISDKTSEYSEITLSGVVSGAADTTVTWTVNGKAVSGKTYVKAGDKVVATATTGATGETAGTTNGKLSGGAGATAKVVTQYTDVGTASGADVTFGASTAPKNGVSTFEWTYAAGNSCTVTWTAT